MSINLLNFLKINLAKFILLTNLLCNLYYNMILNKKVQFEYNILNTWTAGISLKATEVKSLRMGLGSIVNSYATINDGEVILSNMHIPQYKFSSLRHNETAKRKLLLNRKEINKMIKAMDKAHTLIPVEVFFNDRNYAKIKICLCTGKKTFDKRHAIKAKEVEREKKRQIGEITKKMLY